MVAGNLRSRGIHVQRSRLRASMHRVDSDGNNDRRLHTIGRRPYHHSPSPSYVWHLDGTHKLIRWKLVVHAGIDGYSRLITFCRCSPNNRSDTVLGLFSDAVGRYGCPLRVRTDHGVENVRVWEYMLSTRNNTNAVKVGSSVHNQRLEQLHRDINVQVVNHFYNEFTELQDADILDANNDVDLFCLHLIYLNKINTCLEQFVNAYNNHALSTEGYKTPLQLFQLDLRLLQLQSLDQSGVIDLDGIVAHSNNNVQVSPKINPFTEDEFRQVTAFLSGNQYLKSKCLYRHTVEFVSELLS